MQGSSVNPPTFVPPLTTTLPACLPAPCSWPPFPPSLLYPAADGPDGPRWEMVGLVPLFDPPRHDTKETIERCHVVSAYSVQGSQSK